MPALIRAYRLREYRPEDEEPVWVAEAERGVAAFVAATLHRERLLGEISMLAVDPDEQGRGMGTPPHGACTRRSATSRSR